MEDAKTELPLEDWYEYTYVAINYQEFEKFGVKNRFEYLVEFISNGLNEICRIDNLETKSFENLKSFLRKSVNDFLTKNDENKIIDELNIITVNEKILLNYK